MANNNHNFPDHIDYLSLMELDNLIEEIETNIEKLKSEKARLMGDPRNQKEVEAIDSDIRYEQRRLENYKREREDMLGYLG